MKVNIGCGPMVLDGWTNCDIQVSPKAPRPPEILCDVKSIPLEDECADVVMALHLLEHFYQWEAPAVVQEWRRLLKPGGKLILELPNLEAACRNLLKGMKDQMSMWPLYGDPGHKDPYMCHRWGYTPKTVVKFLKQQGFKKIRILKPQTHGRRANRDMRVEAIR
ncbi:MAG: methyltransferase domain-containing protein [Deltaproteobacteria bacterium]|nr:methyltransferase domain-containing protein [Deltaproteobacteria bacterium]